MNLVYTYIAHAHSPTRAPAYFLYNSLLLQTTGVNLRTECTECKILRESKNDDMFKTTPYPHQLEEFEQSKEAPIRALFWEMGLGKTKPTLDSACHLHSVGELDGMLVLAPPGVHHNWSVDEIPTHIWDSTQEQHESFLWQTNKKGTQYYKKAWRVFQESPASFKTLLMTYPAMMTKEGAEAAKWFLKNNRSMYVLDESQYIKTPGSKRTMRIQASSQYAPFRRILTGTPVDDSPFDVFAQIRFLDKEYWKPLGITSPASFRTMFGVFEKIRLKQPQGFRTHFEKLIGFRNLDILSQYVNNVGSRLLKKDVLDLPEKLYRSSYFELDSTQRSLYAQLKKQFFVEHGDGSLTTAELAIQRITRFQQICSGYLPSDYEEDLKPIHPDPKKNPRIKLLMEEMESVHGQVIIFAKYDFDIDSIQKVLTAEGYSVVRYDGRTNEQERAESKRAFLAGEAQVFLGKESVAGTGLTLTVANTTIYYNMTHRLGPHLQSQDRNHRIGQKNNVLYIYLCGLDSIDEKIIDAHRNKRDVAAVVMKDPLEKWI